MQKAILPRLISKELAFMAMLLVVATVAAYWPAWYGGMLWDDNAHFTKPELQSGDGLWRIWFDLGATQQYYPLLHSVFWLQYQAWGDQTLGYHLVNIFLHALNALLAALILRRLQVPGALLAAAIFALHPVHVESVAWMTELKNTLSGFFYLASALAYLSFDDCRRRGRYTLSLGLFLAALLTKTVTATLPAALLVVFWWQRGGLNWRRDVLPLLPFFALGVTAGLFTAWAERTLIGADGAEFDFTAIERCLIAGRVIWFYLGKLLWPTNLIFTYPSWNISQSVGWQYLYPLGMLAVLAGSWLVRQRWRGLLAAILFFCGTLFPVLGFFNVYPFRYSLVADHFQYLASLGIITLFAAGLARLAASWPRWPAVASWAATLIMLSLLGGLTWHQSQQYRNVETLYRTTLSQNPSSWMAHNNLGLELKKAGRFEEAIAHYQQALRLKPDHASAHNNWGNALLALGQPQEAVGHYQQALRIKPDIAQAHYNWGNALQALGHAQEAIAHYQQALRIKPDYAKAHQNLGIAMARTGRLEEAATHLQEVAALQPQNHEVQNQLGLVLARQEKYQEAITHFRKALQLKPDWPPVKEDLLRAESKLAEHEIKLAE